MPWHTPISRFPTPEFFECVRLDKFEPDQIVLKELWVHLILNRAEGEVWRSLRKPEAKKAEWLLGRWAAKDAVRIDTTSLAPKQVLEKILMNIKNSER